MYSVGLVSGVDSDSARQVHISVLSQILFPCY